jgi:site-specific DNA-methyltransferase (adenine-specific)
MILCDLPYGTTACKWDTIIPFEPLWLEYERIIKDNGAIVLTASQPFTSALVMSNPKMFRYSMIWEKEQATNFMMLKKQIGKVHEDINVYYKKQPNYQPQMIKTNRPIRSCGGNTVETLGEFHAVGNDQIRYEKYPTSILRFNRDKGGLHPTQKPVALFEYLIKTYTNENDLVLDNCAGSGTTGVACHNLNRDCILIEQEPEYIQVIKNRMDQVIKDGVQTSLPMEAK